MLSCTGHYTHLSSLLSLLLLTHLATLFANDCMNAKRQWLKMRYDSNALLAGGNTLPNFGRNLDVCIAKKTPSSTETADSTKSASCCDRMTEHEMLMLGHARVTQQVHQGWLQVAIQMKNHSVNLHDFFRSDIQQSRDRMNNVFSRIYGYNYKMHRYFFFGLFADLEAYMAGQKRQLGPIVDTFFSQLRDSIVNLIERSDQPAGSAPSQPGLSGLDEAADARRIRCLSDRVAQQQPFDGVDVLLRNRLLEAYPPARMLVDVLEVASQLLVDLVQHVSNSPECSLAMTRAQFCAVCAGRSPSETCPDTCKRLMSECLRTEGGDNTQLSVVWPRLINSIVATTPRLERSFNFPTVNRYLQMQISEAITNLQSRYTETKSKYDAECRMAAGGRGMPNLFSSASSSTDQQLKPPPPSSASSSSSSSSSWPSAPSQPTNWSPPSHSPGGYRYRPKRSAPVQQEFLDWQYRQPMRPGSPPAFGNRPAGGPPNYALPNNGAPAGGYHPPMPSQLRPPPPSSYEGFGAGGFPDATASAPTDSQEGLIRLAAQMQHKYTSLSTLFADPDGGLCPAVEARQQQQQPNDTAGARCWSPIAPAPSANPGLSSIVKQLSEAGEHLYQAASSTGDPEPLRKVPASGMQYGGGQNMGGPFEWSPGAAPLGNQQPPSGNQFQQWAPNHPAADYNPTFGSAPGPPFGHVDTPLIGSSGIEPPSLYGQDNFGYPPAGRQPMQPEAYGGQNQPPPPSPSNYQHLPMDPNAAYGSEVGLSSGQLPPQPPPDTYYSPTPPGGGDSPLSSSFNAGYWNREEDRNNPPWVAPPSQPPPTPDEWATTQPVVPPPQPAPHNQTNSSLPDETAAGAKARPESPLVVDKSHGMNASSTVATDTTTVAPKVVTSTTQPEGTTQKSPAIPTEPNKQSPVITTPSPKSPLPDDEDSDAVRGPIQEIPPPTGSQLPSPSTWAEHTPDTSWNEPSLSSGILPPSTPTDLENYGGWNPGQANTGAPQPDVYNPPQHGTGFEVPGSFQPQPAHPNVDPSKPVDPVPSWGTPDFTDVQPDQSLPGGWIPQPPESSGQFAENRWLSPDEHAMPDNNQQWPHKLPNSGTFDGGRTGEIDRDEDPQSRLTPPPTPLPPQFVKPQPMLPYPPLPPPEVWVPAKLSPGQSGPSILLVREYNVQGPYYGPETKNKPQGAGSGIQFSTRLTALALVIPITIFYLFV